MSEDAHPLTGRTILVVEDDYFIADNVRRGLEARGAAIVGPVATVADAIALVRTTPHLDAAVLDLNLGGAMAFGVADALEQRGVRFVFATGYDRAVVPARFSDVTHCEKPLQADAIIQALGIG